jgi:hypothetical protein
MTRRRTLNVFRFVILANLVTAEVLATQPLAFKPASGGDFATILTVSGTIQQIGKQSAMIALFARKPFWGPLHYGANQFALWPADTLFIATVPAGIPIIIDGKKAGFEELTVGQSVQVQYNLVLSTQSKSKYGPMDGMLPYMFCAAVRIDAQSSVPSEKESEDHASRKR